MEGTQPESSFCDVVIVGNGPSALILSFILHGNVPYYDPDHPHPDPILDNKLKHASHLLQLDIDSLTDHFGASRFSYSSQALPVNSLIDSLVRPHGETDEPEAAPCIKWRYEPERAVSHVVLGDAVHPGGQWTELPPGTAWDIQSLSYAGMLSLPGYSFYEHHLKSRGSPMPPYTRPSRREIADYLAAYPESVGINHSIKTHEKVSEVSRTADGFYIGSHSIHCKRLVLASGIFTEVKPARPLLQPLLGILSQPKTPAKEKAPLLVIGSGFSAADVIISAAPDQKIIHIYKWEPEANPSPLRNCHLQAYPEYAGVYRLMKRGALAKIDPTLSSEKPTHSIPTLKSPSPFLKSREWEHVYETFPNTLVTGVKVEGPDAIVTLFCSLDGSTVTRRVSGLSYAVGRRGSLQYLDKAVQREILGDNANNNPDALIAKDTLRSSAFNDLQIAKDVFIIGSLTGDSLIRFAYGGCFYVAGKLVGDANTAGTACKGIGNGCTPQPAKLSNGFAKTNGFNRNASGATQNPALVSPAHDTNGNPPGKKNRSWWNFWF
ncbi:hypothetical protein FQN57_000206 [Myotisia sp. PD_48]|nr:hypothetical protein FQN57_000206 [Myotisia sp. PD_48]